jgi:hypothetical protein
MGLETVRNTMSTYKEDQHNRGQDAGSRNGPIDHILHDLLWSNGHTEQYNEGYQNGRNHPQSDDSSESSGSDSTESSSGGCFVTTACVTAAGLEDDCNELTRMRWFRDNVLATSPGGRALITEYYNTSPGIVEAVNRRPDAIELWGETFSSVQNVVKMIDEGEYESAITQYRSILCNLDC